VPKSVYSETYQRFIRMLVDARGEAGLTQVQLAERLGWQQTDISKVERGERRLDIAEFLAFAEAMKIDAAEFIRRLTSSKRR
jgi:transcriptional regulator with XRE-family HTH domain